MTEGIAKGKFRFMVIGKVSTPLLGPYYPLTRALDSFVYFPVGSSAMAAELILRGRLIAGPVNAHDARRLSASGCRPVSDFAAFINPYAVGQLDTMRAAGAREAMVHAPYLLLVQRPMEDYDSLEISVSLDLGASGFDAVLLAKILLAFHWELPHRFYAGPAAESNALLVSGGPEWKRHARDFSGYVYGYDLTWEWYRWQRAPYCLARWMASPDCEDALYEELVISLRRNLEFNLRNLARLSDEAARAQRLERGEVLSYFQGFGHRLGLWLHAAEEAQERYLGLLKEAELTALSTL
jgi:hypothetical protein